MGAPLADGGDLEGAQVELTEHARFIRAEWEKAAPEYEESGRRSWAGEKPPSWGIWGIPESEVQALPPGLTGKDVIELGCGTAYWSAWLARMGARPVGIDITDAQLANARKFMAEFGPEFPLVQASAEDVPFPDASFDVAFSEYGASIWCDPYLWVPEAARLLRPGGELVFLCNGVLAVLTDDPPRERELVRDYFGMRRFDWPDGIDFHLGYGEWIRLLREHDFEIEDLIEIRAPSDGPETRYDWVTRDWAHRWPSEEIWKARKL